MKSMFGMNIGKVKTLYNDIIYLNNFLDNLFKYFFYCYIEMQLCRTYTIHVYKSTKTNNLKLSVI